MNIASVSLQIGYPTVASVPHSVINGFKVCYFTKLINPDPSPKVTNGTTCKVENKECCKLNKNNCY